MKTLIELQTVLNNLRMKEAKEEEEKRRQRGHDEHMKEMEQLDKCFRENLLPLLKQATTKDYLRWLEGFITNGGIPTHVYDYPFSGWNFYVASKDLTPLKLCGSMGINIIFPTGITTEKGDWGHCNLFFMDGFKYQGLVPIFNDINFE